MAVVAVDHDFGGASLRHDQAGRAPWEQSEEEEEEEGEGEGEGEEERMMWIPRAKEKEINFFRGAIFSADPSLSSPSCQVPTQTIRFCFFWRLCVLLFWLLSDLLFWLLWLSCVLLFWRLWLLVFCFSGSFDFSVFCFPSSFGFSVLCFQPAKKQGRKLLFWLLWPSCVLLF